MGNGVADGRIGRCFARAQVRDFLLRGLRIITVSLVSKAECILNMALTRILVVVS
jgi:hypothetical protein